jgi:hypothetical protein
LCFRGYDQLTLPSVFMNRTFSPKQQYISRNNRHGEHGRR